MAERIADHVLAKPEPLVEQTLDHERRTAEVVESNREQAGPRELDGEPSPRGTPRRSSGYRIEGAVLGHNRCPRRDVAQALAAAGNEDENTTKQIEQGKKVDGLQQVANDHRADPQRRSIES